jgi:CDP-diacylglycerol--glycerol-3-phosphate 3-phosphatidyltransferase
MISIYQIKPAFQNALRPLSDRLWRFGVTPNQITLAAILLSFLSGLFIALFPTSPVSLLFLPFALLLRMILNAIDGMLAREHHLQSALGTFLNELGDGLSDAFIFLPFCLIPGISALLIISIVVLSLLSEMAGLVAIQVGNERRYDGPMGKSDRAFVFGAISLLLGLKLLASGMLLNLVLIVVMILLMFTIYNRAAKAINT